MSEKNDEADSSLCCASCGIAEVDDIKLKKCTGCYLVRYCSIKCQRGHWPQHKRVCRKRAAELRDELLFKQPESTHLGDCPICMIPMPIDPKKSTVYACCSKVFCNGCDVANEKRENEANVKNTCPFCRKPWPSTVEEGDKWRMKRVEINDPVAIREEGIEQHQKGDDISAFEYYKKASKLGDVEAHYRLSKAYHLGLGVEKDEGKEIHHTEEAAIGGHPEARHNLGCSEWKNGNNDRAVRHWIIAASQGYFGSIVILRRSYKSRDVSKEDLDAALRAYQAAEDATKSPQREAADEYYRNP